MVKTRQEFLGNISALDKYSSGIIDGYGADLQNIGSAIVVGRAAPPTVAPGQGAFWADENNPTNPKFTDGFGNTITLGSGGGGGGTLAEVLAAGNDTGPNWIQIDNGLGLQGDSGFDINIQTPDTGSINLTTGTLGTTLSGGINLVTSSNPYNTGNIYIQTSSCGMVPGAINILTGSSGTNGAGGDINIESGGSTSGNGGGVYLDAGNAAYNSGGYVEIFGASTSTGGGGVSLFAGDSSGGSINGAGASIVISPGNYTTGAGGVSIAAGGGGGGGGSGAGGSITVGGGSTTGGGSVIISSGPGGPDNGNLSLNAYANPNNGQIQFQLSNSTIGYFGYNTFGSTPYTSLTLNDWLFVNAPIGTQTGNSIEIFTPDTGSITVETGQLGNSSSGNITLQTGNSISGPSGNIVLSIGSGVSGGYGGPGSGYIELTNIGNYIQLVASSSYGFVQIISNDSYVQLTGSGGTAYLGTLNEAFGSSGSVSAIPGLIAASPLFVNAPIYSPNGLGMEIFTPDSGTILIQSGYQADASSASSGGVTIQSNSVSTSGASSGSVSLTTGNSNTGSTGSMSFQTGYASGTGTPGSMSLSAGSGSTSGGSVTLSAGASSGGPAGNIALNTGSGNSGTTYGYITTNTYIKVGDQIPTGGNPSGGGYLFSQNGAGRWKGSSGTTTTFGPAEPHCPRCGRDFANEWENSITKEKLSICMPCLVNALSRAGILPEHYTIKHELHEAI